MIKVKQGDRKTVYYGVLDADTGLPVDLTGATVTMTARLLGKPAFSLPIEVTDAAEGMLSLTLDGTLMRGSYMTVVHLSRGDEYVTIPTDGMDCLEVEATIGAVA